MPGAHTCKHTLNNSNHALFRFMVGCGRCDDWFHGDCVGLDLIKVREMEEEDQMYVCLKCCDEESKKVEPEPLTAAKPEVEAKTEAQDHKSAAKSRAGPSQTLAPGGVRPVRKVSSVTTSSKIHLFDHVFLKTFKPFIQTQFYLLPQLIHPLILNIASVTTIQGFVVFLFFLCL